MGKTNINQTVAGNTLEVPLEVEMDAYDNLPKLIRQALSNANNNYSAYAAKCAMSTFHWSSDKILEVIKTSDRCYFEQLCKSMRWNINELDCSR